MSKEAMKLALKKIASVNAMDYEYQAWAKEALANEALERMSENARELGLDYDTPAQHEPLTDEEIEDIWADCPADWDDKINVLTLARAIEAAHGIKENT